MTGLTVELFEPLDIEGILTGISLSEAIQTLQALKEDAETRGIVDAKLILEVSDEETPKIVFMLSGNRSMTTFERMLHAKKKMISGVKETLKKMG